ncbi:hypothetical protein ACSBL2_25730 [Pedobacter sp. AW31-3R]|uniref:hypothetical protein n=1 Tax=Pedobacter sp. AW31-3R TaxID=3445781 RepID=UPI003F9F4530
MSFEIIATPRFKREIKKLVKKYTSLKDEFARLIENLVQNPEQGTSLGNNWSKVITHIIISDEIVYLLTIYDKSQQENISNKELKELLSQLQD